MTSDQFQTLLAARAANAGIAVPLEAQGPLEAYFRLLRQWNSTINLTALPLDPLTDRAIDRLLVEPLVGAGLVGDDAGSWLDVGSGGGSPAIPMKLVKPGLRLTMVESKSRKAAFLREAVRTLGLADTVVADDRFEDVALFAEPHVLALVTVRAVRVDATLFSGIHRLLKPSGKVLFFHSSTSDLNIPPLFRLVATVPAGTGDVDQLSLAQPMFHVEHSN